MDIYIHVFLHVKLILFTHETYDYTILPSIFPVIAENCASIVEMNNNRLQGYNILKKK